MTNMVERQAVPEADPVDQLIPPPPSTSRVLLLLAVVVIALGLAAVAPVSGAVRPNLAFDGTETGPALAGAGTWEQLITNRGWTTATIDQFDLDVAGVDVVETTFLPTPRTNGSAPPQDPGSHGPVVIGDPITGPVEIPPGERVVVRFRYTYDSAQHVPAGPDSSVTGTVRWPDHRSSVHTAGRHTALVLGRPRFGDDVEHAEQPRQPDRLRLRQRRLSRALPSAAPHAGARPGDPRRQPGASVSPVPPQHAEEPPKQYHRQRCARFPGRRGAMRSPHRHELHAAVDRRIGPHEEGPEGPHPCDAPRPGGGGRG